MASRCQPGLASRENKGTMWLEISPAINVDTPVSGVDPGESTLTIDIVLRCLFRDQDCLEGGNLPPKTSAPLEGVLINPRGFAVGISIPPPPEYSSLQSIHLRLFKLQIRTKIDTMWLYVWHHSLTHNNYCELRTHLGTSCNRNPCDRIFIT